MSGIPDGLDGESQAKVKRTLFNGGVPIEVCLLQTGYNIQRISPLRLDSGDSRGLTQCIGHHRRCPGDDTSTLPPSWSYRLQTQPESADKLGLAIAQHVCDVGNSEYAQSTR